MTLPPSDAPDWLSVQGGARLLGSLTLTGNNVQTGTFDFTPLTYDGAVYIVRDPLQGTAAPGFTSIIVQELVTLLQTLNVSSFDTTDPPLVAFVSRQLGATWRVSASVTFPASGGPFTDRLRIFAVPSFPAVQPAQTLILWRRAPYTDKKFATPGAGVAASVAFTALTGLRWVVDSMAFTLRCGAATADARTAQVLDGATSIWEQTLSIGAVANAVDHIALGPGLGLAGSIAATLTVQLAGAPPANVFAQVAAGVYQS